MMTDENVRSMVEEVLAATPFTDIHTHLFAPRFGGLGLWGIDELLTYHYLEAELFRSSSVRPEQYFALTKTQQADLIWKTLFVENTPVSESTRGVIAVLHALGLDTSAQTLKGHREFFREQILSDHISNVFQLAGIDSAVMTNDPLDPLEAPLWSGDTQSDPRFHAALRIDRLLNDWTSNWPAVRSQGYDVEPILNASTLKEIRLFVADWSARMKPVYMAVSLPDTFQFPADDARTQLLTGAILPSCQELNIPLSLMIGVRRQVNPALRLAGDGAGRADLGALERLCVQFPDNRFLVSVLSRENQHELCVYARKFSNLMPFGCWWFLNNPSLVEEITRERIEMLGMSFIPQHSDARILEQIIYKWRNTRRTLAPILTNSYRLIAEDGRAIAKEDVERDVTRLFRTNFSHFVSGTIST